MPDISTGIMAGSAVLGGLGGSQSSGGGTTTQNSEPWGPQQDYLKYGFGQAKDALGNALRNPVYTGNRVAGLNPFQTTGANWLGNYTQNNGFNTANALNNTSVNLLNSGANYGANANSIFGRASVDPTAQIITNAGLYANNPYVDGVIDAASRDVTRNLFETQLPGIDRAASGSGNLNSTRAGVETAIAKRGAADRLADLSSNIRSQFFNTGLTSARDQYNQNLTNMLNANSGLLNSFNSGVAGANAGQNVAAGNFDALNAAGGLYNTYDQNLINADMAKFNETNAVPMDYIAKYMASINGNYGGSSTTTAPSQGGGFLGGATGALGGFLGGAGAASKLKTAGLFG